MADRDPGPIAAAPAPDPHLARARLDLNDLGNARRLAALAGGTLKFVGELGRQGEWVHFDGRRWSIRDGRARALALAQRVVEDILAEARAVRMASPDELSAVFGPKFTAEMADERAVQLFGCGEAR